MILTCLTYSGAEVESLVAWPANASKGPIIGARTEVTKTDYYILE